MLCETIALSTVSYFSFTADTGMAKQIAAKAMGKKDAKSLTTPDRWEVHATEEEKKQVALAVTKLEGMELKKHYVDQSVMGDASETGLVKFVEPLFRADINKGAPQWPTDGIEGYRNAHPILTDGHPETPE